MILSPLSAPFPSSRARTVTTVAIAPAQALRPARAAEIAVSGPALPDPAPLLETGAAQISEGRESMRDLLARALDIDLAPDGGPNLAALAGQARRSGRYDLARSAETFIRLSGAFDATASALNSPGTARTDREGLVRRAISDIASARVEPDRLRRDIASLQAVRLMALTGASARDQERALAFRRAVDAAAVTGQRHRIIADLTEGWKSGALSVAINRAEVGTGQTWTLDRSRAHGTQAVFVDPAGFGAGFAAGLPPVARSGFAPGFGTGATRGLGGVTAYGFDIGTTFATGTGATFGPGTWAATALGTGAALGHGTRAATGFGAATQAAPLLTLTLATL